MGALAVVNPYVLGFTLYDTLAAGSFRDNET